MKVIIDINNPVTVVDREGNVLFEHQPFIEQDTFVQDAILEAYK